MLFNPSPGQLADRMTILCLKAMKVSQGEMADSIHKEITACHERLQDACNTAHLSTEKVWKLVDELAFQNEHQWMSEDWVRESIKLVEQKRGMDEYINLYQAAKANAEGNEKRAAIVHKIDELFGYTPEFKQYR